MWRCGGCAGGAWGECGGCASHAHASDLPAQVWGFSPHDTANALGQNAFAMECLVPPLVINGTLRKIRALYAELDKGNGTLKPLPARTTAGGALAVPVFPIGNKFRKVLYGDFVQYIFWGPDF